jgi:hypothetical protein
LVVEGAGGGHAGQEGKIAGGIHGDKMRWELQAYHMYKPSNQQERGLYCSREKETVSQSLTIAANQPTCRPGPREKKQRTAR